MPDAITEYLGQLTLRSPSSGYVVSYDEKAHAWSWAVWQDHLHAEGAGEHTGASALAQVKRAWDEFSTRLL